MRRRLRPGRASWRGQYLQVGGDGRVPERARRVQGPYQVTASTCINKDLTCALDCVDARETCNALTQSTLDAALASCTGAGAGAVSACVAANPGGGSTLQDCITTAQANAFTCRDAALEAAGPGFAACAGPTCSCVHGCPSAQSGSAAAASVVTAAYGPTTPRCTGASHDVEGVGASASPSGSSDVGRRASPRAPRMRPRTGRPSVWTRPPSPRMKTPSKWEFEAEPYGWISGNYGSATVKGNYGTDPRLPRATC